MDIIGKKYLYFLISIIIIIPGLVSLILFGLNLSIDFTGGTRFSLLFPGKVKMAAKEKIRNGLIKQDIRISTIEISDRLVFVRTSPMNQGQNDKFIESIAKEFKGVKQTEFETIGPTVGKETTANAVKAIMLACVLIVLYITWAFRKVPKPVSSFRFGICTIIALIHDVLVVVGVFSILGHFFKIEIDSLFITAVLTIIGFSVHDTIVVFDRIRENLKRMIGSPFPTVVNDSILQTLSRSLNTSITTLLALVGILIFGGESIRWFVVALIVGITSGTYSSIFNAAPLLVVWHEWKEKRTKN
jgi:preprotein translocase subunit SecF